MMNEYFMDRLDALSFETSEQTKEEDFLSTVLYVRVFECENKKTQRRVLAGKELYQPVASNIHYRGPILNYPRLLKQLKDFSQLSFYSWMGERDNFTIMAMLPEICDELVNSDVQIPHLHEGTDFCYHFAMTYGGGFRHYLYSCWEKYLKIGKDGKVIKRDMLTVRFAFFADLLDMGLFNYKKKKTMKLFDAVLDSLIDTDLIEHENRMTIVNVVEQIGTTFAALVPRRFLRLAEKYNYTIRHDGLYHLSTEKQTKYKLKFTKYYDSLTEHLVRADAELAEMTKKDEKGKLDEAEKEKLKAMNTEYEDLYNCTARLADMLDRDIPTVKKVIIKPPVPDEFTQIINMKPEVKEERKRLSLFLID